MPGLVAGIHVLSYGRTKDVDGRNKSGHDEERAERISHNSTSRYRNPG